MVVSVLDYQNLLRVVHNRQKMAQDARILHSLSREFQRQIGGNLPNIIDRIEQCQMTVQVKLAHLPAPASRSSVGEETIMAPSKLAVTLAPSTGFIPWVT